ncbi:MAG: hypothetical protein QGH97_05155 [Dehalococcoidia bacterium]|jgi:hypothetical protein|nr:hypothetical protein [Dehalococcoidia bacterium]MDP7202044.1 hypothetical protein [Dehalococcoidia bacterium]
MGGDGLAGMFSAMDQGQVAGFDPSQRFDAAGAMGGADFQFMNPESAFAMFDTMGFDQALGMGGEQLAGIFGAMDGTQIEGFDPGQLFEGAAVMSGEHFGFMDTEAPEAAPEATPVPEAMPAPEATAVPAPTPTPALPVAVNEYGLTLKLDQEASVRVTGWTGPEPNSQQGAVSFVTGGGNVALIWAPQESRESLTFLADTYSILRASQPAGFHL